MASTRLACLERKLNDLENQSKRNNIVTWKITEGTKTDSSCQDISRNTLTHHLQMESDLEVLHVHRTNIRQSIPKNTNSPLA